jgi:hypothetical protein
MTHQTIKRVLVVKERLREMRRVEVAQSTQQVENAELRTQRAVNECARAIHGITQMGEISARELVDRVDLVKRASVEERGARTELMARVEEKNQCVAVLQEIDREVRVYDALRERFVRSEKAHEHAREQSQHDEAAQRNRGTR